VDTDEIFIEY